MPAKIRKPVARRSVRRPAAVPDHLPRTPQEAGEMIKHTWESTLASLNEAQQGLEKQVKSLLKRNKIDASDAGALMDSLNAAIDRERKKALKQIEARVKHLQARVEKERKVLARTIDGAVQSTLGTLNIPSRREVAELTRKVEALSARIDRLRR